MTNNIIEEKVQSIIELSYQGFDHSDNDGKTCASHYSARGNKYTPDGKNNQPCDCGADKNTNDLRTALLEAEQAGYARAMGEVREIVKKSALETWELSSIFKEALSECYQARFNKNLDYDQWVGIRDHLEDCARNAHRKMQERTELNIEALTTPTDNNKEATSN